MDIKRINSNKMNLYEIAKKDKDIQKNNAEKTGKALSHKPESPDKITISSEAKNLNIMDFAKAKIKADMNRDLAEMNPERVAALKERIRNGNYRIDAGEIAASVVSGGEV